MVFINIYPLDNDAKYYSENGNTKFNTGDYAGALMDYNKALALNPKDAMTYYNRGKAKFNLGKIPDAVKDYSRAIKLEPGFISAYDKRGEAEEALGDYAAAVKDFDKKIGFNPRDYEIYYKRAGAKDSLHDYDGAVKDYDKAIEFNPKYTEAFLSRGLAKCKIGDYKSAIKDFDKTIELSPKDPVPYYNRAHAKESLGDHNGAVNDFNKAIEFSPNQDEKVAIFMQLWVQKHNDSVPAKVMDYIKPLLHSDPEDTDENEFPAASLDLDNASEYNIPDSLNDGTELTSLSQAETGGQTFLIAGYGSDTGNEDDSNATNVYIKIGTQYELLFMADTAQFITLGKNSPVFLKVGFQYNDGYGTSLYTVKKEPAKTAVFESNAANKTLKADLYLKSELKLYAWQEGYVCFKDLNNDGLVEIIVKSVARMPEEAKEIIAKKFNISLIDMAAKYAGPWGEMISIYEWDGSKFKDLGDYYDH